MSQAVCNGALLRCTQGSLPGALCIRPHGAGTDRTMALATVQDARPLVNLSPFGNCLSTAHPLWATGSAPCVPQTCGLWQLRAPAVHYAQAPALRSDATLQCQYGGLITITDAGQQATGLREQGS